MSTKTCIKDSAPMFSYKSLKLILYPHKKLISNTYISCKYFKLSSKNNKCLSKQKNYYNFIATITLRLPYIGDMNHQ